MDIIDLSRLGISGLFILLNIVNYFRQRKLKKKIKDCSDWIWLTVGFEFVILCLEVIIILILDQNYEKLTLPLFHLCAKISLLKPQKCHAHILSFLLCEFVFSIYKTILDLDFNRICFWINVAKSISNGSLFILFVIPPFWKCCFKKNLPNNEESTTNDDVDVEIKQNDSKKFAYVHDSSNLFSKMTFSWILPMYIYGYETQIDVDMLEKISSTEKSSDHYEAFKNFCFDPKQHLFRHCLQMNGFLIFIGAIFR